ncbi:fumarylacetoacetate hydrolase family protein [Hydrogenophaga sp.]|uniref:fumarylacetoacetate hydrolase family protein n=1 Tax=Hydrogenophaga sp. TaxID=1904254 RepID=UPI0035679F60
MIQLVTFATSGGSQTGLLSAGKTYPSGRYAETLEVLSNWADADARLDELAPKLAQREAVASPRLLAPLPNPRNIYFAGANYRDHVAEMKATLGLPLDANPKASGQKPWFCLKATGSSVVGPDAVVSLPRGTAMLDWELELAVVIGKQAKNVAAKDFADIVAGYTVANDLSARDHVGRAGVANDSPFKWDWIGQKSFDGSCPMGPALTPTRFVGDPMNLAMKLWVNGELMQDSNTSQMIFDIGDQIEHLSACITLHPGDVILTGTPAGVGMARKKFLKPGDVVKQWIENIGAFEFTIAA